MTTKTKKTDVAKNTSAKIDSRKKLLARVAGDVASGVVSSPSEATASADAVAAIAVEIAEAILKAIGI